MMPVPPTGPAARTEAPAAGAERDKLERAARDFEALLVSELLRAARASGSSAWLGGEDAAADSAFGLAEQHLAEALARGGGLGLARLIVDGLEAGAGTQPASAGVPQPNLKH